MCNWISNTVAPIIQNKLVPLFVDVNPKTLNADREQLHEALHNRDVCGVTMAHTLGFPFDAFSVAETTKELGKWFIEDIADALGAEINDKRVGTFGDASILRRHQKEILMYAPLLPHTHLCHVMLHVTALYSH